MRFGIQSVGSEGDIRPLIALGAGLRHAGHEVAVAVHGTAADDWGSVCRLLGLEYIEPSWSPSLDTDKLSSTDEESWARELTEQFWRAGGHEDLIYDAAMSLCATSDAVVGHYLSYPTKAATIKTDTPLISVQLTHEHTATRYRPPMATLPNFGETLNPVMWKLATDALDEAARGPIDEFWRRKALPPFRQVTDLYFSETLNLLAVSPVLCRHQPDWNALHVVTGMLDLPALAEVSALSPQLREFIASGGAPVCIAFGSTQQIYPGSDVDHNLRLMREAALRSGCRAVIQTPCELEHRYPPNTYDHESRNLFFVGRVPYSQVFGASAAVVHHGGSGTSQLAIRCGRPSVVVPFTAHHWFFACELNRVGVAPKPVRRRELTAVRLADLIRQILDISTYRERAGELGHAMQEENGVALAVDAITTHISAGALAAR